MNFLTARIFDGVVSMPPDEPLFHLYPNRLTAGGEAELHEHPHDHLVLFDCTFPDAVYGVEAILPDGRRVDLETKRVAGAGVCALIKRYVKHRIWLKEGEIGAFCCMFSHYDESGCFLADPKVDINEPAPPVAVLVRPWWWPRLLKVGANVALIGVVAAVVWVVIYASVWAIGTQIFR